MPSSVFLDTSGWIPLLNATEHSHHHANDLWLDLGRRGYRVLLTDLVIR
jgi:predicted nucleic acid-binding protein